MRKPHQACFSAGRAEARSSDPLITFEKGECVFCHLKGQLFIEFIHPAIVFHMEWFLQKDLTSAQVYPVPRLCLPKRVLPLHSHCTYKREGGFGLPGPVWGGHTLKHVACLTVQLIESFIKY